jgi:flagellar biosynthesis GTPase FlhF
MNKTIQNAICWTLGIMLLMLTVFYFGNRAILSGIISLALGFASLPPLRGIVEHTLKREVKLWQVVVVCFLGAMMSALLIPEQLKQELEASRLKREAEAKKAKEERAQLEEKEKQRKLAQEKQEQEKKRTEEKQATQAKKSKPKPKPEKREEAVSEETTPVVQPKEIEIEILDKLSLEQRMDAFRKLRACEKSSLEQADAEFGAYHYTWNKQQMSRHSNRRSELLQTCTTPILQKYNITRWELGYVDIEGAKKGW